MFSERENFVGSPYFEIFEDLEDEYHLGTILRESFRAGELHY